MLLNPTTRGLGACRDAASRGTKRIIEARQEQTLQTQCGTSILETKIPKVITKKTGASRPQPRLVVHYYCMSTDDRTPAQSWWSPVQIQSKSSPQKKGHTFSTSALQAHGVSTFYLLTSPYPPYQTPPTFLYLLRPLLARTTLDGFTSASSTRYPFGTPLSTSTMAETAAPVKAPAAEQARPTRPDEQAFNEALVKAEKEHKASMDRFVSLYISFWSLPGYACNFGRCQILRRPRYLLCRI